jgi:probable biosynthetic protein (TIGR04098 family)
MNAAAIDGRIDLAGLERYELELGMRHLGPNGLLESVLYKEAIDFRLRVVERQCGVLTRDVRSAAGRRLYPSVFFLELQTPPRAPLSCFGENDTLRLVTLCKMAGRSLLDGYVLLGCPEHDAGRLPAVVEAGDFEAAPFAWLRAANQFVDDEGGTTNLRLEEPVNVDPAAVGTWPAASSTVDVHRSVLRHGLGAPPSGYRALAGAPLVTSIAIDVETDLNGVGLLYFAGYVHFMDIAERRFLQEHLWPPVPDFLIEGRTPVRRTICFYGNAAPNDAVLVETRTWVQDRRPERCATVTGAFIPLTLWTQSSLYRASDRRLIAVAEAEKAVTVERLSPAVEGAVERVLVAAPRG